MKICLRLSRQRAYWRMEDRSGLGQHPVPAAMIWFGGSKESRTPEACLLHQLQVKGDPNAVDQHDTLVDQFLIRDRKILKAPQELEREDELQRLR